MSRGGYLVKMLDFLTSAYAREDIRNSRHSLPLETNIGKLFGTLSWGLGLIHDSAEKMVLWDNLDNAEGAVLDRYGANFGVERGGTTDKFFRLKIRVKMMAQLSGGDDDTIINAAAELLDVELTDIELEDDFPAKKKMLVNALAIPPDRKELLGQIAASIKRLLAAGVGFGMYLVYVFRHIIEVSYELEAWSYAMPPCNTLYCGTFPSRATLGWTASVKVECPANLDVIKYLSRFCGTYPILATLGAMPGAVIDAGTVVGLIQNDGKLCGVTPSDASKGWSISDGVAATVAIIGQMMMPPPSGADKCGTIPSGPSAAWSIAATVISQPDTLIAPETPPFCSDLDCGTHPGSPTLGLVTGVEAEASAFVTSGKCIPARSGTAGCGTSPERVVTGRTAEAEVVTSGEAAGAAFDAPYGVSECGTSPETRGAAVEAKAAADILCSTEAHQVAAPFCNTKYCGQ